MAVSKQASSVTIAADYKMGHIMIRRVIHWLGALLLALPLIACSSAAGEQSQPHTATPKGKAPMVKLTTNFGVITLELDAEKAPKTVANFLQYV